MTGAPWPAGTAYLTLATASADGRPWATPVWFAPDGDGVLWVSRPGRRHSLNIAERPEVAFVVFDSSRPPGDAEAVYAEGIAAPVPADDVARAIAVYSTHGRVQGLAPWTPERVTGAATLRLYRARITALWTLDESENRVELPLPGGGDRADPAGL